MSDTVEVRINEPTINPTGLYGEYGGVYVPPVLEEQLKKLSIFFDDLIRSDEFKQEYIQILKTFVGRPSPLYYAKNLSELVGSKIYLKREDLNHMGAHKINNAIGQCLIAKKMGATEIIAETGAGSHAIATASACAMLKLPLTIFMGAKDVIRQQSNVKKAQLLGAKIISVTAGEQTLKDAVDASLQYYIENPTAYCLVGSNVGPAPYPQMVSVFQSVIGEEARQQILIAEGRLPDTVIACVGGGSNSMGIFASFLPDANVMLAGAEGGGQNIPGKTAATLSYGKPLVFQGAMQYCLVDADGNPAPSASCASGLDYPGISPIHSHLKDAKRVEYHPITDAEAIEAFKVLSREEGIIPAIESSHALALAMKLLKNKNSLAIVNLSGRGDKDVDRSDLE